MGASARAALALLTLLAVLACSTGGPPLQSEFERNFERYLSQPHQKAMAIAGDPEGRFVYGSGWAFRTTLLAIDQAFEECNRRRGHHGVPEDAECRLYAVGNEVVEGNPDLQARYGSR